MSADRKPLVGWTYDARLTPSGFHNVYDAEGNYFDDAAPQQVGIPAPRPPRTGTLGLNEEDTREHASVSPIETPARHLSGRMWNATIRMCRADVARWEAEDEAAATAEPDTLTLPPLPIAAVKHAAKWWTSKSMPTSAIGFACKEALIEAGKA